MKNDMSPHLLLRDLFDAAVGAASPANALPDHLPEPPAGKTVVIGFGKAAASMAKRLEDVWPSDLEGFAVTRYGHGLHCRKIEILEAGHPVPDDAAVNAAERALSAVAELGPDDLVLCLVSGGGSALLTLPAPGIPLAAKQGVTRALLASGAAIGEINCVRKHLSAIKGGRLAASAAPARVVTLAISDVPGDDPATIASGPTVADPTTVAEARAVLARYRIAPGAEIEAYFASEAAETPKSLPYADFRMIARPADALAAAAQIAAEAGCETVILGDDLAGEASALGSEHASLALRTAIDAGRDIVILSGGETTVTLPSPGFGRGGRNTEYLLALAIGLDGAAGIHAIACDTDGIDGTEDSAGAVIGPDTLSRARSLGVDAAQALATHDSYGFFSRLGDLIFTGPTRTNVNDFRAILISAGR